MKKSISVSTQKKLIGQALNNTKTVAVSTICRKTRQRAVFSVLRCIWTFLLC